MTAQFDFERCPVVWRHRIWGAEEFNPDVSNGIFFYGEKETVFVTDDRWITIPKGKNKDRKTTQAGADMGLEHMKNFLECVRTRKKPFCSIQEGFNSTTTVKLAMIALDLGQKIEWMRPL